MLYLREIKNRQLVQYQNGEKKTKFRYMKRKVLYFLLFMACIFAASAQNTASTDSAALVVNRYLRLLNFESLRTDSILYIESYIINRSDLTDTTFMRRWHVEPNQDRVELWHGGELGYGLVTDGKQLFKKYNAKKKVWETISASKYFDDAPAYDFHGPLYRWKTDGLEMHYQGEWNYNGNTAYRILIQSPTRYDRYYMFEKESGLLFLIDELSTHSENMDPNAPHVDWRACHEFTPLGRCLFPSIESYQYNGAVTIIYHHFKYLPLNPERFTQE